MDFEIWEFRNFGILELKIQYENVEMKSCEMKICSAGAAPL